MPERTRLVSDILRFSIRDGPGIRTTVFFKGCPLECRWCHNPESQSAAPELVWRPSRCIRCGACEEVCPTGAVSGRGECTLCGACAAACPSGAREILGRALSVRELFEEIRRDLVFFEESKGGVTFSGGEPLLDPEYLRGILEVCRAAGIRTAVDTCGHAPPEAFRTILRATDLFLYDVKLVDPERHRKHTGVSNERILENLKELAASGAAVVVRYPVVPGINDDLENASATGRLLADVGIGIVELLPYHGLAREKYRMLRRPYGLAGVERPSAAALAAIADAIESSGVRVRVIG